MRNRQKLEQMLCPVNLFLLPNIRNLSKFHKHEEGQRVGYAA